MALKVTKVAFDCAYDTVSPCIVANKGGERFARMDSDGETTYFHRRRGPEQ